MRPTAEEGTDDDQKVLHPHWTNNHSSGETYSSIYLVDKDVHHIGPIKTPEEKRLVRKFDRRILPLMCIVTFIQFADKMAINYAVPLGIRQDTSLEDSEFSTVSALFYVGFLCYQIPNNYCLQYIPLGIYISILLMAWGTVLAFTSMCTTFEQLAALRFLLGVGEGGVYPCLALLVSTFYRRSEQTLRLGACWLCNGFAIALSGFIHYGIGHIPTSGNVHGWMWCMIILGCTTVSIGIVCLFTIIDDPRSLRWHHNAEEQELVEERAKDNAVVRTARVKYQHMWEAIREVRFWLFCMTSLFVNLLNGAMTNYSVSITESFGFHGLQSIMLQVPSGCTDVICVLIAAWLSQRTRQTLLTACGCLTLTTAGLLLVQFAPWSVVKLIGLYLCWSYAAAYVLILASISNNVCGYTKKIFFNGMMMIFYTAGNIAGPFLMIPAVESVIVYVAAIVASTLFLFLARQDMTNINQRRLHTTHQHHDEVQGASSTTEEDLTDKQDPYFVYRL